MDIENSKAQMRKGVLELCILATLAEGEKYPSDIMDRMREAELLIVEGTLYPLLTRLKNDGLLTYRWAESTSGPPRKYFTLTEAGQQFLTEMRTAYITLSQSVAKIITPTLNA